jgi:hypothetical protein
MTRLRAGVDPLSAIEYESREEGDWWDTDPFAAEDYYYEDGEYYNDDRIALVVP